MSLLKRYITRVNALMFRKYSSVRSKTSLKYLLADNISGEDRITVQGWVKSVRKHKDSVFLDINDGSCQNHLQVIVPACQLQAETAAFGSCVEVTGFLQPSPGAKQDYEVKAESLNILGECNAKEFPFKRNKRHSLDYVRQYPHLRPKTNYFSALTRIRHHTTRAIQDFFHVNGFMQIHTPILTSNDCEGAGEVFQVEPKENITLTNESSDEEKSPHFFNVPTFLTVSGQLHLEVMAGAFANVYTFGPTFRAENSRSRHHLSEFYMVEGEQSYITSLSDITQVIENLIKSTTQYILDECNTDMMSFVQKDKKEEQEIIWKNIVDEKFPCLSYKEAIEILERKSDQFTFKPKWGEDLHKEHEKYLVEYCHNVPVYVTDFPAKLKPFYSRQNDDGETTSAVDLLAPGVGEICGGSLREERHDVLHKKLQDLDLLTDYQWYLDLRRFGSAPHGGFGLGFERYLQTVLGIDNIKDAILFPRSTHNCKM